MLNSEMTDEEMSDLADHYADIAMSAVCDDGERVNLIAFHNGMISVIEFLREKIEKIGGQLGRDGKAH